jgi:hypothetical protein
VTYRTFRRRLSESTAGHGLLEIATGALGAVLFAVSAFCVYATVLLIAHFRDLESGFPAGPGFVQGVKGFGLVLFPVFALITASAGWGLAGDHVDGLWRRIRRHGSSPGG